MRRREFIALMGASATWPVTALAQQAGQTYRLGMVSPLPCEATPSTSPMTLLIKTSCEISASLKTKISRLLAEMLDITSI